MSNDTQPVLLSGVGGQGAILAADILSRVAMACGQDVKLSEIHGMAQRGGAVTTVVRLGDSVASMVADKGSVDYLVSFEKVEALRNKEVDALIVQKPYLIGSTAATYMIEYLTRGTQPEQYTYLEPCIAYYDDLENPEINQYFYDAVE